MKKEIWKDIPGWEGYYQASNLGKIKSLYRQIMRSSGRKQTFKERNLKFYYDKDNRTSVCLFRNGIGKTIYTYRLVLLAFVGPCPEGMECCHNDGNPQNNRLENLRWDTSSNNEKDKLKHGTSNRGENHPMGKLNRVQVKEIRKLGKSKKLSHSKIAKIYGISRRHAGNIIQENVWKWLK